MLLKVVVESVTDPSQISTPWVSLLLNVQPVICVALLST